MATAIKNPKTSETGNKAGSQQVATNYGESSIVLKAICMAETMKKYPRPVK